MKQKNDLERCNDYLTKTQSFIDKQMITILQQQDNYILDNILKTTLKLGVNIDENKLKKWINFCNSLDNVDKHYIIDKATKLKINKLQNKIHQLEEDNEILKSELAELKNYYD